VDAVKIGMLGTRETVHAVRDALELLEPGTAIVIDPVMVSESGAVLLDDDARQALVDELLPLATVITPNLPEARVLVGDGDDVEALARALHALGADAVVVTGGHRDEATDLFFDGGEPTWLEAERIDTPNTHGTGCVLSSTVAAYLARGEELLDAVRLGQAFVTEAIRHALAIGQGIGPVDPLFEIPPPSRS